MVANLTTVLLVGFGTDGLRCEEALNCVPLPVIHTCSGKHFLMLARKNLVAHTDDQRVPLVVEPSASMVRVGGGFFQDGI
jgi:hypothetical protein